MTRHLSVVTDRGPHSHTLTHTHTHGHVREIARGLNGGGGQVLVLNVGIYHTCDVGTCRGVGAHYMYNIPPMSGLKPILLFLAAGHRA